jgi:predicted nucleic acid-binding protein
MSMSATLEHALDTCRILHACATIDDPLRNRSQDSPLDKEVRELQICPKSIRREIQELFMQKRLLIPEVVIQELTDHLLDSNSKLNNKNREKLRNILGMIKGRVVKLAVDINDYKMQEQLFCSIEEEAQKRIKNIEMKTNSDLEGWENQAPLACRNPILREVYKDPICKTWQKIMKFKDDVVKTALGLKTKTPFLLNDLQIILTAKKRKALISTHDGDIKVLLAAYNTIAKSQNISQSNKQTSQSTLPKQQNPTNSPQIFPP